MIVKQQMKINLICSSKKKKKNQSAALGEKHIKYKQVFPDQGFLYRHVQSPVTSVGSLSISGRTILIIDRLELLNVTSNSPSYSTELAETESLGDFWTKVLGWYQHM